MTTTTMTPLAPEFSYNAKVQRVVDGDTIDLLADLGFNVRVALRTRLYGLNTPELTSPEGRRVRDMLRDVLPVGHSVVVKTFKDPRDKFGRWLAVIYDLLTGLNINEWLLQNEMAVPYMEGKK